MTLHLLWCERCGRADGDVRAPLLPDFAVVSAPLTCMECREPLTLLRAEVIGTHGGGRTVAYVEDLPKR